MVFTSSLEYQLTVQNSFLNEGMYQVSFFNFFFFTAFYLPHRTVCGLTQGSTGAHLARAVLEAVCFQTREILDSMQKDSGIALNKLQVDGGMTCNNTLMQLQADIAGVPVGKYYELLKDGICW